MPQSYHTKALDEVIKELNSSFDQGLTTEEVELRLTKNGLNELPEPKKRPMILVFLDGFKSILVLLLLAATAISFFLGEQVDAIAILSIVLLNAIIGFAQEYKAEKAIEALKKLATTYAKVLRNGQITKIESKFLVPGDIILVEAGDKIPADARIIESINLEVSEALLTGEPIPVKKVSTAFDTENLPLADRKNLLFKDTSVTYGRGKAIVYATGGVSEVGKISLMLKEEEAPNTPLQIELEKVGKHLSFAAIAIILFIFLAQIFFNLLNLKAAFLTAVSLAVAAIPEGLPTVITIVLAIGVSRLAQKKAIIRKLSAVETLGSTTHILTDKTGTLTQNRMVVTKIYTTSEYGVEGQGYTPEGGFLDTSGNVIDPKSDQNLQKLLNTSVLCNDSVLNFNKEKNAWEIVGDITEGALVVCGAKAGFEYKATRDSQPRIFEIPFSSDTKLMLTVHIPKSGEHSLPTNTGLQMDVEELQKLTSKVLVCVKGAPEVVLKHSVISEEFKTEVMGKNNYFASLALRSLGFAYKEMDVKKFHDLSAKEDKSELFSGLTFLGLMGQEDPLRLEVKDAVRLANKAGITTIMVTGDHLLTAKAIAKELGILKSDNEAVSGEELTNFTDEDYDKLTQKVRVFARVSPEQKLKLVKAFKRLGSVVAVTGDGINDAPAIKAADIGVAMGIEGTDVAKEASDMVLQNDNYATIVDAVKEGRTIFDNLIKFIRYLISCNISEIFLIFAATVTKLPLPLLPIHLLWINLVTDGFPSLALGMEPAERDVMDRRPRSAKGGLLNKGRWITMAIEGIVMGTAIYIAFVYSLHKYGIDVARTIAFLSMNISQLVHSLNNRSEKHSLFKIGITQNRVLLTVFVISILVQLPVIYTKFGDVLFNAVPLNASELLPVALVGLVPFILVETMKFIKQAKK